MGYILSAGRGLVRADFLTPYYEITFSPNAEGYKRRRKRTVITISTCRTCPMKTFFFRRNRLRYALLYPDTTCQAEDDLLQFGPPATGPRLCVRELRNHDKIFFALMEPEDADHHTVFVDGLLMSPGTEDYTAAPPPELVHELRSFLDAQLEQEHRGDRAYLDQ